MHIFLRFFKDANKIPINNFHHIAPHKAIVNCLFRKTLLCVMLVSCNHVDNIHVEKSVKSMLSIDFPFTNPCFCITAML